ncbi:hypothetical protein G7059_06955 [Erysipelothrix sp. HDW6A]|uniref:hypothetical protein n=1 Tax=Erysipelothrix sp. HDW6A TaxID=2714928 RepID=UPI00140E55F7|nr:hypothetical protein [Erysipelothrix sp. HDW6A]QIK57598.1 hypothetical protein G7059_06955 [Erysipelothrix sp. HDW6A]
MNKIMKLLEPTKNRIISGVIVILVVVGGLAIWSISQARAKEPMIVFKDSMTVEYGAYTADTPDHMAIEPDALVHQERSIYEELAFDEDFLVKKSPQDGKNYFNTMNVGVDKIIIFAKNDGIVKSFEFEYEVKDTRPPEFNSVMNIDAPYNTVPNYADIIRASDIVDGELEVIISGDIDYTVPGIYTLEASASDINGKSSKHTFFVTVKEEIKGVVTKDPSSTSNSGNNTATKPTTPSKPVDKPTEPPKTVEKPKPVEPEKPSRPAPEAPTGMFFYKDYGNTDGCIAVMHTVKKEYVREWVSNFCDVNGYMYYAPRN